jgi:hypothetical protein
MLNIVVSCTYRKRRTGPASKLTADQSVRLRGIEGPMHERSDSWWNALDSAELPTMAARDLYAGEHWSTSLKLPELAKARGFKPRLWVCSAGYGLISGDTAIKPYSATFSPGPDSVHRPGADAIGPSEANESWWTLLANRQLETAQPRTLSELHSVHPDSKLLVVASERYTRALRGDISAGCLDDPERVLLISAGYPPNDKLAPLLLPADARFQQKVGGVRQALNARLAKWVLEDADPAEGFGAIRARFQRELERAPALQSYDRTPMGDDEVSTFIEDEINKLRSSNQKACHSPLLRRLRDQGNACEQSRFRRLFADVEAKLDAATTH